jgi:hypothetical protein
LKLSSATVPDVTDPDAPAETDATTDSDASAGTDATADSDASAESDASGNADAVDPAVAVRECVRGEHADFLEAVAGAGRVTANAWERAHAPSREAVVEPFERVLRETGTLDAAPRVLAAAVDAAGGHLQADPVPSPPYVAVTAEGVVLRATTDVGRVVVTVAPFAVARDPVRYVHRDADPGELVAVDVHYSAE